MTFSCYAIDDTTVMRSGYTVVLWPRDPARRRIPPRINQPVESQKFDFTEGIRVTQDFHKFSDSFS